MISVTRHSSALAFLLLGVTLVGLHLRFLFFPFRVETLAVGADSIPRVVAAIFVYMITAAIVGRSGNKMRIFQGYCAFPIFLFGLYAVGVFVPAACLETSVVALTVAIGQAFMLNAIMQDLDMRDLFYSALAFGVASCLNPVCLVYLPILVLVGLTVMVGVRRMMAIVSGFLLPIASVAYFRWYGGDDFLAYPRQLAAELGFSSFPLSHGIPVMAAVLVVTIVGLEVASAIYFASAKSHVLRERQAFISVCISSFLLLAYDIFSGFSIDMFPVLAVSGSLLVAYGLDQMKPNQGVVVYRALVLFCLIHLFVM